MKRSSSPENDDGPAQKRLTKEEVRQKLEGWKQWYKQVDTSGTVIWSGTVKIPDKIVFDCSIKTPPHNEGIKSLFPQKQLTIHILPSSAWVSILPYKIQVKGAVLCTDENTDMMSYSAFSQAIRFDREMRGCVVLKNTASALHLLYVSSFSSGHEDYIIGYIITYHANDTVLGILRSHGLLPCGNPEHKELAKQNAMLEEELRLKDKKLIEQQRLNQKLVKRHKKKMAENKRKHEEERNIMAEQMRDKERTITTLDRKIKDVLHGKEEIVTNMYLEFQCSICRDTIIEAHYLPSCRHMFCKFCIGQWLEEKTKCPLCNCEAGIPIPSIVFDRTIDNFIGHLGNEAKQQRIKAVKDREAFIEINHERSFLVSSEESEGQSATSEGESVTSDGESVSSDGQSVTAEQHSMTGEEAGVPEHSGWVRELDTPMENLTDSSSEESTVEAVYGERLRREQEARIASYLATLPPCLPLSPSSEDEPILS